MSKWTDPTKKQQLFMINRTVLNKLKAYADETETPFDKLIESEFSAFEQALIKRCAEIDEVRFKALEAAKKQKDDQALADQFPLKVTGKEVEPITKVETVAEAV